MATITASPTLPLPTNFSPPASCFSTITFQNDGALVLGYGPNCVPSGADTSERAYAFSPALHCPPSYTTAGTVTLTAIGTGVESRAICCPTLDGIPSLSGSAMSYNPDTGAITHDAWYSTLGCTISFTQTETLTVLRNGTTTTSTFSHGFNAYSVQIAWQSSDVSSVSATLTSTGSSSSTIEPSSNNLIATSTTPTISSNPTASATSTISSNPTASTTPLSSSVPNSDLSTGAKAAIGVLAPLAALGLLFAAILLVRYRRRTRSHGIPKYRSNHQKSLHGPGILLENQAP